MQNEWKIWWITIIQKSMCVFMLGGSTLLNLIKEVAGCCCWGICPGSYSSLCFSEINSPEPLFHERSPLKASGRTKCHGFEEGGGAFSAAVVQFLQSCLDTSRPSWLCFWAERRTSILSPSCWTWAVETRSAPTSSTWWCLQVCA